MKNYILHRSQRQRGTVLAVSLLILLVLTIIGVSSMSSSSLQEKMSGNFRDREVAFQAAETALAYAEDWAGDNIVTANGLSGNDNGLYQYPNGPSIATAGDATWWTGSASVVYPNTIPEVKTAPRYIIEYRGEHGEDDPTDIVTTNTGESTGGGKISSFRITVRATGLSDNTQVILQSYFGKRL